MTTFYINENFPGALLCLFIAVPAWLLGIALPVAAGPVASILLGMLTAWFWRIPQVFKPGIKATGKRVLQTAIILFGFQMNLSHALNIGAQTLLLLFSVILAVLFMAYLVGKALSVATGEQILIGVGTAICGVSAIAVVAPVINADDEQVATAISTVFLFNVIAVFVFPALGHLFGMSDFDFGVWAGAAINDTSSAVAAGYTYSVAAGNTATVVKLTRTLMIIPITLILSLRQRALSKDSAPFRLRSVIPWFIAGFMAACGINTALAIPSAVTWFLGYTGRFFIIIAMAGIGLGADLREFARHGKKPLLLGFCLSLTAALVSQAIIIN